MKFPDWDYILALVYFLCLIVIPAIASTAIKYGFLEWYLK